MPSSVNRPSPVRTEDNEEFWASAGTGELAIQRCTKCGRWCHPPRPMCPDCHSLEMEWASVSGFGTVYSYAFLHHPQHPAFEYPVKAALVQLDEGVRLVSNLVEVAPEDVRIGMPVEVTYVATADDQLIPVFRPQGADR